MTVYPLRSYSSCSVFFLNSFYSIIWPQICSLPLPPAFSHHPVPLLFFSNLPLQPPIPKVSFHTTSCSSPFHLSLSSPFFPPQHPDCGLVWPFNVSLCFSFPLTPPILSLSFSFRLQLRPSSVFCVPEPNFETQCFLSPTQAHRLSLTRQKEEAFLHVFHFHLLSKRKIIFLQTGFPQYKLAPWVTHLSGMNPFQHFCRQNDHFVRF